MYDGSVCKGPRLEREKEGFVGADLAAWQPDGKPLFSCLANQALWPCLTSTLESQGLGLVPGPVVLRFGILRDRDACAWLADPIPAVSSTLCPACTTKAVCPLRLSLGTVLIRGGQAKAQGPHVAR